MSGAKTKAEQRYGERFADALAFATAAHQGQVRKGAGAPYITHPLAVASLIGEYGGDEDQAIAGLLHDVIEDCDVSRGQIAERFGERVARIVAACTDTTENPKPPWRARKEQHLAHIRGEPAEVKLVICADKLHNAGSIVRDLNRKGVGQELWSRFTASKPEVIWYYQSIADALADGWDDDLVDELRRAIAQFR